MIWSHHTRRRKRARNPLTYANVVSTIAVFIALGGGAYAATTLPANSVGAPQIRAGAVDSRDIQHGAIQPADLSQTLANRLLTALVPPNPHPTSQPSGTGLGAGPGTAVGTTPFVPPRGNNACARFKLGNGCVDAAGQTKKLGFLDSHTWTVKCPPDTDVVIASFGYSLGIPVPAYVIDTTSGAYSGATVEARGNGGLFTATNWTVKSHNFTPHTACTSHGM